MYNAAVNALSSLLSLEEVVKLTINRLDSYDPQDILRQIVARREAADVVMAFAALESIEGREVTRRLVADMVEEREAVRETITRLNRELRNAIKEAEKGSKLDGLAMGLRLLSSSIHLYTAMDQLMSEIKASSVPPAADTSSAQWVDDAVRSEPQPAATNKGKAGDQSEAQASTSTKGGETQETEDPVRPSSPVEKMWQVYGAISELENSPLRGTVLKPGEPLPDDLKRGLMASAILAGIGDSDHDKLYGALKKDNIESALDALKSVIVRDGVDLMSHPAVKGFMAGFRPSVIAPAGITDREARLSAQRKLDSLLVERFYGRLPFTKVFDGLYVEDLKKRLRVPPPEPNASIRNALP